MITRIFLLVVLLVVSGCSGDKITPFEVFIESKSPDEIYAMSGGKEIITIKNDCQNISKQLCKDSLNLVINSLKKNGYSKVDTKQLTPSLINRFLTKIDMSEMMATDRGTRSGSLDIFN